jgi:protein-tyrosine phosphatase
MIKVLFICMGNICRSPTAHAVMQHKIDNMGLSNRIEVDSAGTHAYHTNEKSDPRSRAYATSKGIDMEYIRARKVSVNDYDEFDYIVAMDNDNLDLLHYYAPDNFTAKVSLFLAFANRKGVSETVVPDPYYGGDEGFANVFNLVNDGCDALIEHILNT